MKIPLKRALAMTITALISVGLWAQPSINRDDLFEIGDSYEFLGLNATSMTAGPAGNGVTWNFPNLVRDANGDGATTYVTPVGTPNAASFPDANIAQAIAIDGNSVAYQYYSLNNDRMIEEGQDTTLGLVILENKRIFVDFPFAFNTTQMDTFSGSFTINTGGVVATVMRTGTIESTYDGFGTLNLGTTTHTNVKRIKSTQEITDVANIMGVVVTTTSKTTSYSYFNDQSHSPLLNYVEAETTSFGITTNSKSAVYQDLNGTSMPTAMGTYAAHLTAQGGDFDTEIIIRNPTGNAQVLTLNPFSVSGGSLASVDVNLPANGTTRMLQENYFPTDAVGFSSTGCDSCIFTSGYRAAVENASTAHVHQTSELKTEYYFYPGEWNLLFDGAAIINAGSEAASIEASQIADDGTLVSKITLVDSLAPGGKFLDVFNGKFANNPNTILKLESTQPMAVMILRISQDQRFLYQNLSLPDSPGQGKENNRWIAHITSDTGGFATSIIVHNRSGSEKTVTLSPFGADGGAQADVPITVPANSVRRFAKSDLLNADASHASISGATDCVVSVGYQSNQPNSSTAQIHEAPAIGTTFFIYPGEWDQLFDGLALINVGDGNASILATQIRDDGLTVGAISLHAALPPNAKYLDVLEGMLAPNPDAIIRIDSTEPLAILALRLSKDSRFLYGNNPLSE